MTDSVGKKWEQSFHEGSYVTSALGKDFFLSYAESKYIQLMIKFSGIKKGDWVLEAGCGSGKLSVVLATMGYKVTALDYSEQMLKNVAELAKEAESYFGKVNIEFKQGDLGNLELAKKYKLVFNEGVVEHWLKRGDRVHVIGQMRKVTEKGGTVAVFVPNGVNPLHFWWVATRFSGYYSAPKMTRYSTAKLRKEMAEAGLEDFQTDGIDAYYTFNKWPRLPILDYPIGYAEKHFAPPKYLREIFGTNIVCMGKNV